MNQNSSSEVMLRSHDWRRVGYTRGDNQTRLKRQPGTSKTSIKTCRLLGASTDQIHLQELFLKILRRQTMIE